MRAQFIIVADHKNVMNYHVQWHLKHYRRESSRGVVKVISLDQASVVVNCGIVVSVRPLRPRPRFCALHFPVGPQGVVVTITIWIVKVVSDCGVHHIVSLIVDEHVAESGRFIFGPLDTQVPEVVQRRGAEVVHAYLTGPVSTNFAV